MAAAAAPPDAVAVAEATVEFFRRAGDDPDPVEGSKCEEPFPPVMVRTRRNSYRLQRVVMITVLLKRLTAHPFNCIWENVFSDTWQYVEDKTIPRWDTASLTAGGNGTRAGPLVW
ncbi:unnamed protein product [Linum trigynum]|uniref:Uncharacterized protein n=1 Tax=Linum trigynum TaxID=586398 RepID=A0AAV2G9K0_9ROSI